MRKVLGIVGWVVTTILGFVTGSLIALAIYIAPPPYPYFDWEPYFDQIYAEEGCEGAEWFATTAHLYGNVSGPRQRYAGMYLQGTCDRGSFEFEEQAEAFLELELDQDPKDSLLARLAYYTSFLGRRLDEAASAVIMSHDLLDSPNRRAMAPDILAYGLRCNKHTGGRERYYVLRHRVAERLEATELHISAWDRRWEECSQHILNVALQWERTETMPPQDKNGAELLLRLNWELLVAADAYQDTEIDRLRHRWLFDGYADWSVGGLYIGQCPADWSAYASAYREFINAKRRAELDNYLTYALYYDWSNQLTSLGRLHERGQMVPQSDTWAYYWYSRAAGAGADLSDELAGLTQRLDADRAAEIDALIAAHQMPEDRPPQLVSMLRRQGFYHIERREDGLEPMPGAPEVIGLLTPEDTAVIQTWITNGEELPTPEYQRIANGHFGDQIDWVDCETGEPPAWAQ